MLTRFKYLALLGAFVAAAAQADYDQNTGSYTACAAYQRANGTWSRSYKVRGFVVTGAELIDFAREHGYSTKYSIRDHYFMIPWDRGGFSALRLGKTEAIPKSETTTADQGGKTWRLKDGWQSCY